MSGLAARPITGLALCAGYGGTELGLRLALGGAHRTLGYVERDAYAAAVLVGRMADAVVEPAPVWDDVTTFDGAPWRGRVDCITAGFPCQPFSAAGKQLGLADERWLWPSIADIIRDVEPGLVFLENVPGLTRAGLAAVLGSLADLGFDAEWTMRSAEDDGAPHRRKRFWLLAAHPDRDSLWHAQQRVSRRRARGVRDEGQPVSEHDGENGPVAHPDRERFDAQRQQMHGTGNEGAPGHDPDRRGGAAEVGDAEGARLAQRGGAAEAERSRPQLAGVRGVSRDPAPTPCGSPSATHAVRRGGADLLHTGWWASEPALGRVADGSADRSDELRVIGNGVVPIVACNAFLELLDRFR